MSDAIQNPKNALSVEKALMLAMKTPGVKVMRGKFLRRELIKYFPEETVQQAIDYNPAKAGIPRETINSISRHVINYETNKVTGISVAASLPSSAAPVMAVGSATADIISFFAHILRVVQKLAYLYGFEEFELDENDIDSETMNFILVFLGVMFGVQGAGAALNKLAEAMAAHVAKNLAKKALMKGAIYPIVKNIAQKIGIKITKQVFADTVASGIPILGSVLSGGLTYAMFKPCCLKLKKKLMSLPLSDPEFYTGTNEEI